MAQRCAQAARDTTVLIEESGAITAEGERTLQEVESSVRALTASAVRGKDLVDDVHAGCRQQSDGMQRISQAITAMSQITQRAAATAQEEAAAGILIFEQMGTLAEVVGAMNRMVNESHETST